MSTERLTELEYLQLFYQYADFGPADGDVRQGINDYIEARTGMRIPSEYEPEE